MPVLADVQPTAEEIDQVVGDLETSWTATITSGANPSSFTTATPSTREIPAGTHRLQANNALFWKTLEFTLGAGEHASFAAANRAGWGTYSVLAFFIGFLGAGPFYLTFEREGVGGDGS